MIRAEDFSEFAPNARDDIASGVPANAHMLQEFGIDTPLRVSHFMAQIAHESAGFRTTQEYASGAAYEGRRDLGNTKAGDGRRYKGHGLIQCTGRHNHRAFTQWCQPRYPDAPDFEAEPDKLMEFPWALLSAVWYWDTRDLNLLADKNDLRRITRKINGGYNGLKDRQVWFNRAWKIWGTGDAIQYAGKGKKQIASKTNIAAAGAGVLTVGQQVVSSVEDGKDLWDRLGGLFTFDDPFKTILVLMVLGLVGFIIWDRYRKAVEFEI